MIFLSKFLPIDWRCFALWLVATGASGIGWASTTSTPPPDRNAAVDVTGPVSIVTAPVSVQAAPGGSATFSVAVSGTAPFQYQWSRNGEQIPGATLAQLTLTNLSVSDVAAYAVTVTNEVSSVKSAPVTITGPNPAPTIISPPQAPLSIAGKPTTLSVTATGAGPLTYQWRRSGYLIPGATAATLTIPQASRTDAGIYDVVVADGLSVTVPGAVELRVAPSAYPTDLRVDPTFAPRFEAPGGVITAIVPLPGGKFIVSGEFSRLGGVARPGLAQVDTNLEVDSTFQPPSFFSDVHPRAFHGFGARPGFGKTTVLAVQPDGKILVTHALPYSAARPQRNRLMRLLADGTVDSSFVASPDLENVLRIALQPDGRIIAIGISPASGRSAVNRLHANGALDPTYAPAFTANGAPVSPDLVVVQPNGRAVYSGGFDTVNGVANSWLIRLTETGALDSGFQLAGASLSGWAIALAVLGDGRLLVGGNFTPSGGASRVLGRLSVDGAWEGALLPASEMIPVQNIYPTPEGKIWAVGVEFGRPVTFYRIGSTGALEVKAAGPYRETLPAGYAPVSGDRLLSTVPLGNALHQEIVRFGADGARDGVFTPIERRVSAWSIAPGKGGKIYAASVATRVNGIPQKPLVRLNGDGSTDTTFALDPALAITPSRFLELPDGRVVVSIGSGGVPTKEIVRLLSDGQLDPTFDLRRRSPDVAVHGRVTLLADGRLLVGSQAVFKDGEVDPAFQAGLASDANAIALPDGSILVGNMSGLTSPLVGRLGRDGAIVVSRGVAVERIANLALLPDGRALVGGARGSSFGTPLIVRLGTDLRRDAFYFPEFPAQLFSTTRYLGPSLLVQENGAVIASDYNGITRLLPDGSSDPSFVLEEIAIFGDSSTGTGVEDFFLSDDGRLMLSGPLFEVGGLKGFGPLRLGRGAAPVIVTQPAAQTAAAGGSAILSVTAGGVGPFTYQWFRSGKPIAGATSASLTLTNLTLADAGNYTVKVSDSTGAATSVVAALTVTSSDRGLVTGIAQANTGQFGLSGAFTVEGPALKQMLIRAIGPTLANFGVTYFLANPRLRIVDAATGIEVASNDDWGAAPNAVQAAEAMAKVGAYPLPGDSKDAAILASFPPGTYRVLVALPDGALSSTVQTPRASLEIYDADPTPRLVYLATGAIVGNTAPFVSNPYAQGIGVFAPTAGRSYLIRLLGPALGLTGAALDPRVEIYRGVHFLAGNSDWQGNSAVAAMASRVGAMPIPAGSKDAAMIFVPPMEGVYTIQAFGAGYVWLEIFEDDPQRSSNVPLAIVSAPRDATYEAGQNVKIGVVTVGQPAAGFQWRKNGTVIPGSVTSALSFPAIQVEDAGQYSVLINNGVSTVEVDATVAVTPANNAVQTLAGRGYKAGQTVTITNTIRYVGPFGSLNWSVNLPFGWTFASDTGSIGNIRPAPGMTGNLTWSWNALPPSPAVFSYTLNVPAGTTYSFSLQPLAQADGIGLTVAPLALAPEPPPHSADPAGDYRISLLELTRVIELYNTRNGSARTGCYRLDAGGEDGFAPEPARVGTATVTLTKYHAGDSNRDGKFSLLELTRVIELYNYRSGTTRTGEYHVEAGTEDGFAPGP